MDFKPRMHGFLYVRPSGSTHTAWISLCPTFGFSATTACLSTDAPISPLLLGVRPVRRGVVGIQGSNSVLLGVAQHTRRAPTDVRGDAGGRSRDASRLRDPAIGLWFLPFPSGLSGGRPIRQGCSIGRSRRGCRERVGMDFFVPDLRDSPRNRPLGPPVA